MEKEGGKLKAERKLIYPSNIKGILITIWGGLTFFSSISGYILKPDLTILIMSALILGTLLTIVTFLYDIKKHELYNNTLEINLTSGRDWVHKTDGAEILDIEEFGGRINR